MPSGHYYPIEIEEVGGKKQSAVDIAAVTGIVEYTEQPFGMGNLTSNGVQYSTEILAATGTTDYTVESVTIEPSAPGDAIYYEFGLAGTFKATSSTTADIIYQWQARNKAGTWVNLHSAVTKSNLGTAYITDEVYSGRFKATTNLNRVPFDVQLIFQCNEDSQGYAKTKNSSYVKAVFSAD